MRSFLLWAMFVVLPVVSIGVVYLILGGPRTGIFAQLSIGDVVNITTAVFTFVGILLRLPLISTPSH